MHTRNRWGIRRVRFLLLVAVGLLAVFIALIDRCIIFQAIRTVARAGGMEAVAGAPARADCVCSYWRPCPCSGWSNSMGKWIFCDPCGNPPDCIGCCFEYVCPTDTPRPPAPTKTWTPTPSQTATQTPTDTPTLTPTITASPTPTLTDTPSLTPTDTPSSTPLPKPPSAPRSSTSTLAVVFAVPSPTATIASPSPTPRGSPTATHTPVAYAWAIEAPTQPLCEASGNASSNEGGFPWWLIPGSLALVSGTSTTEFACQ